MTEAKIHIGKLSGGTFCGTRADILNTVTYDKHSHATCNNCLKIVRKISRKDGG